MQMDTTAVTTEGYTYSI